MDMDDAYINSRLASIPTPNIMQKHCKTYPLIIQTNMEKRRQLFQKVQFIKN